MIALSDEEAGKIRHMLEFCNRMNPDVQSHRTLAINLHNIQRKAEEALAILTKPEPRAMRSAEEWAKEFCGLVDSPPMLAGCFDTPPEVDSGTLQTEISSIVERIQADAVASRPDVAGWKPLHELIAEGHKHFWVYTKSFGLSFMSATKRGIFCEGQFYSSGYAADCLALAIPIPAAPSGKGETP